MPTPDPSFIHSSGMNSGSSGSNLDLQNKQYFNAGSPSVTKPSVFRSRSGSVYRAAGPIQSSLKTAVRSQQGPIHIKCKENRHYRIIESGEYPLGRVLTLYSLGYRLSIPYGAAFFIPAPCRPAAWNSRHADSADFAMGAVSYTHLTLPTILRV